MGWRNIITSLVSLLVTLAVVGAAAAGTTSYVYDALGRVIAVQYGGSASATYAYDAAGNRTMVSGFTISTTSLATPLIGVPYSQSITTLGGTAPITFSISAGALPANLGLNNGSSSPSNTTGVITGSATTGGTLNFTVTATDANHLSTSQPYAVTIIALPIAGGVSLTVAYNSSNNPISANLSGGPTASVTPSATSNGGAVSVSGLGFLYTPPANYTGPDSFTYTATGPGGTSAAAGTVTIGVNEPPAPTVGPVSLSSGYNSSGSATLAPSGVYNAGSLAVLSRPSNGTATISGTTATYAPNGGYYGGDSFTYTATGPGGTSAPGTVTVSVANPPAPTAGAAALTVDFNAGGSVALAPGGVYSSLAVGAVPAHGTVSISGATATYAPSNNYYGSDSFTYTVSGPGGTSSPGTVTVTVNAPPAMTVTIANSVTSNTGGTGGSLAPNIPTITGGSGSLTYAWTGTTTDTRAVWVLTGTRANFQPSVTGVNDLDGCSSTAKYTVTVTDTVTNLTATSNQSTYTWFDTTAGACGPK